MAILAEIDVGLAGDFDTTYTFGFHVRRENDMREPSFGYILKIILKILGACFLLGLIGLCLTSFVMLLILGGISGSLTSLVCGSVEFDHPNLIIFNQFP